MSLLIHSDEVESATITVSAVTGGKTITNITSPENLKSKQTTEAYLYTNDGTDLRVSISTPGSILGGSIINFVSVLNCDTYNPVSQIRIFYGDGSDVTLTGADIDSIAKQTEASWQFNFTKYQHIDIGDGLPSVTAINIDFDSSNGQIGRIFAGNAKQIKLAPKNADIIIQDRASIDISNGGEVYSSAIDTVNDFKGKIVALTADEALGDDFNNPSLKSIYKTHGKGSPVILLPIENDDYGQEEWVYGVFSGVISIKKIEAKTTGGGGVEYWMHESPIHIKSAS